MHQAKAAYDPAKAKTDAAKVVMTAAKSKMTISKAAMKAARPKTANPLIKPKKQSALLTVNNIVLTQGKPLFGSVMVSHDSTKGEFKAFMATLKNEAAFWKGLNGELAKKANAKKKGMTAGSTAFMNANNALGKACKKQAKKVKKGKAKSGKYAFKAAVAQYLYSTNSATLSLTKAMLSFESKANKKLIKGYRKAYKKQKTGLMKANVKAKAKAVASSPVGIIIGVVLVAGIGFAIWWFKCRKTDDDEKNK